GARWRWGIRSAPPGPGSWRRSSRRWSSATPRPASRPSASAGGMRWPSPSSGAERPAGPTVPPAEPRTLGVVDLLLRVVLFGVLTAGLAVTAGVFLPSGDLLAGA